MWNLKNGNLVLTEAECALFKIGLDLLLKRIEEDIQVETNDTDTGVTVFDVLTPEQKITLLADTAYALVDLAIPIPVQTAVNEGAIAAVISMVWLELETELNFAVMEAGDEKSVEIRRLLRAVFDRSEEREEPLPDENSIDPDEWGSLLEEFKQHIFWDTDFAMGDEFLDLPPEVARKNLYRLGIDADYFLVVPDEPDRCRLTVARQTLARLLGLPVVDDDGRYPALEDLYHRLTVGPCSPEEIAAWTVNPWIEETGMPEPEWDCDYPIWKEMFSQAVPITPFQLAPATTEDDREMPRHLSVERHGDAWVVRDDRELFWCGLIENGWTCNPDDESMPALTFPTEAEARAAYFHADRMYDEREKRHEQAIARLKLDNE